ncbi:MAG TPA: hypothetical protein VGK02_04635 [Candidatus Aquicultor sp.]|jgi:hypothetical protein
MKRFSATLTCLLSIFLLSILLSACEKANNNSSAKSLTVNVVLPRTIFVGDYQARCTPRKITYLKTLPLLTAKTEQFSEKEVIGWFKPSSITTSQAVSTDVSWSFSRNLYGLYVANQIAADAGQKAWDLQGEETGTLVIRQVPDNFLTPNISFSNPTEYHSYGLIPKGPEPQPKVIFVRESISETEAIVKADAYINAHGGMPADAVRHAVSIESGVIVKEQGKRVYPINSIYGYSVSYSQRYQGIPVYLDSIAVTLDEVGVTSYSRTWHKFEAISPPKPIINPRKAVDAAVKYLTPGINSREGIVVSRVQLRYYNSQSLEFPWRSSVPKNELSPYWYIRVNNHDVRVNALTGNIVEPNLGSNAESDATVKKVDIHQP